MPLLACLILLGVIIRLEATPGEDWSWHSFADAAHIEGSVAARYESLTEAVSGSDIIVVGRVVDVVRGREWVAAPALTDDDGLESFAMARFASVDVRVEQVLKGSWAGDLLSLEYQVFRWTQVDQMNATLPAEPAIFFVHEKVGAMDVGYLRVISAGEGVIASRDGVASLVVHDTDAPTTIQLEIAGQPFDWVVGQVAALSE